jgi:hypothetical protein
MTSGMVRSKDEAERLRIGIRGGWLKPADAVAWADKMISESSKPDPSLLDVALGGKRGPREKWRSSLRPSPAHRTPSP